jgi:uncharacterized Zn finger protein (UPF0148 family)
MTTRCTHPESRKPGHRYCPKCHASYMREWRRQQREEQARLRAIAERYASQEQAYGR